MKKITTMIMMLAISLTTTAQLPQDSLKTGTSLQDQYKLMLSRSRTLDGYKIVNPNRLAAFWASVRDSISFGKNDLVATKKKVNSLQARLDTMDRQLRGNENALANANAKLDELQILGLSFKKGTYNAIVWSIILILALALTLTVVRSLAAVREARYRAGLYNELSEEHQRYKTKANEKEKKLARELQDERNKLEEFKNQR
ncbi:hypothetical protein [Pedobacter faecalis]|uniref:hypothetical protein n=1 Tax=Pedobacter faecalis TaxID=3041495 RepID=UPI00254DB6DA|nr:hypothetical protein [Pedobacter sp. ELA7]